MTLEEILQLHKDGRLDAAESAYREHLMSDPDDADAMHLLGVLRQRRGDPDEAGILIERAIATAPDRAQYHLSLGGVQMHQGDVAQARDSFETALALDPNSTQAHSALGHLLLLGGDAAMAEQRFKIARRADEDDPTVLFGLGNIYLTRGDSALAVKYLSRAAEQRPDDASIQAGFGRALLANGADSIALQAFENALALDPGVHIARLMLGRVHIRMSKPREAQACFEYLRAAGAHVAMANAGLGDVARLDGDVLKAVEFYRAALALDPTQTAAALLCAGCLQQLGKVEEAAQCLRTALQHMPAALQLRQPLATLLAQLGRDDDAVEVWREASALAPGDSAVRTRLAAALEVAARFDAARAEAEHICSVRPGDAEASMLLARAALRARDASGVLRRLDEMRSPTTAQLRLAQRYRGFAHDTNGNRAAAIQAWLDAAESSAPPARRWPLAGVPVQSSAPLRVTMPNEDMPAPVFLLGAPGSGVERIAALLADQPGLIVLADRFGSSPRHDDFNEPHWGATGIAIGSDSAAPELTLSAPHVARRYRRGLQRLGFDRASLGRQARVIDWLPNWDARLLPRIAEAMPHASFILVERPATAIFLNWLAFGGLPGFELNELARDANWLRRRLLHQAACMVSGLPVCRIVASTVLANPTAAGDLADAVGIGELRAGARTSRTMRALGGLPIDFSDAHALEYADVLHASFETLAGL